MEESKKICIVGNVLGGTTGYEVHTRFLAEALEEQGYEVSIDCNRPTGWELGTPDKLFKILSRPISNDIVIFVGLPNMWSLKLMDRPKHFIGFFVWEGTNVPKQFIEYMNKDGIDQIWCPSSHVKDAILNTGNVIPPIYVIPEGVDIDLFVRKDE